MTEGALVALVAVMWLMTGVVLGLTMSRRGHNGFGWFVVGTLLGPIAPVLALSSRTADVPAPVALARPAQGPGSVDVLVGHDGSPDATHAMSAALRLLGDRAGRVTLARVVPYETAARDERRVRTALQGAAGPATDGVGLEVLRGAPASALEDFADDMRYDLIVIGRRGTGAAKTLLGSAATQLTRSSRVPVLVVGPDVEQPRRRNP
jgi:nucleotide-binding universal stress UspA family protein